MIFARLFKATNRGLFIGVVAGNEGVKSKRAKDHYSGSFNEIPGGKKKFPSVLEMISAVEGRAGDLSKVAAVILGCCSLSVSVVQFLPGVAETIRTFRT